MMRAAGLALVFAAAYIATQHTVALVGALFCMGAIVVMAWREDRRARQVNPTGIAADALRRGRRNHPTNPNQRNHR